MSSTPKVIAKAFVGLAQLVAILALATFLPAGAWRFVEGWIVLGVFFACSLAITLWLARRDPALLERRVAAGPVAERRPRQKIIQALASLAFLALFVVPGLDHRWSWSHVPTALVALGDVLVVVGFAIVFLVFRENTFAAAVVEVAADQRVIATGPYARVRHPMYAGALVLLTGLPIAFGSYWGLLGLVPFVALLVSRLLDEERALAKELVGYEEYRRKTRWRLIPGVW